METETNGEREYSQYEVDQMINEISEKLKGEYEQRYKEQDERCSQIVQETNKSHEKALQAKSEELVNHYEKRIEVKDKRIHDLATSLGKAEADVRAERQKKTQYKEMVKTLLIDESEAYVCDCDGF